MENDHLLKSLHHMESAAKHVLDKSGDFIHRLESGYGHLNNHYRQLKEFAETLPPDKKQNLLNQSSSHLKEVLKNNKILRANLEQIHDALEGIAFVYESNYNTMSWEKLRHFMEELHTGYLIAFRDLTEFDNEISKEKIRKKIVSFLFINVSPYICYDAQCFFVLTDDIETLGELSFLSDRAVAFKKKPYTLNLLYELEPFSPASDFNEKRVRLIDALKELERKEQEKVNVSIEVRRKS